MASPAYKRAKYYERVDSISILQAECRARGGTAVWVYYTIGKEKRVRVTAYLQSFTTCHSDNPKRRLRIMRERVAREALAHVRKEPLLPSTVPLYLSPPATNQSSRVYGPVYSGIPHGGPLAALQSDDEYELTDAEKSNVKASLQPNLDPPQLFASQGFNAGMEFAMSTLIVATFRRSRVPAAR
ncbi:hypothetical protein EAF00_004576 [Botryotinia globosa]|nr:hypothetical protein EAF00_004576 [Botryotinia globosa]